MWDDYSHCSGITKGLLKNWSDLSIEHGVLYYHDAKLDTIRLVTPECVKPLIFSMVHNHTTGGHMGNNKTYDRLRLHFYWPGMKDDVTLWITRCDKCQLAKPKPRRRAPLHQTLVGVPMERIAADIMSTTTPSQGYDKILVVCDYFTKWAEAYPIKTATAYETADVILTEWMCRYGIPRQFHSDQGGNFKGALLTKLCHTLNIAKTTTTPYRPQSDGLVERMNRSLIGLLRCVTNEARDDWVTQLPMVMMAYRASPHASTRVTPNRMMFGREIETPLTLGFPPKPDKYTKGEMCAVKYVTWVQKALEWSHEKARENLQIAAVRQKRNYDYGTRNSGLKPKQWVVLENHVATNDKLLPRFVGPFIVVRIKDDRTAQILDPGNDKLKVI